MEGTNLSSMRTDTTQNDSDLHNVANSNRSYDSVKVAGQGLAHLGDTLFSGPISIQNLVFPTEGHGKGQARLREPRTSVKANRPLNTKPSTSTDSADGIEQLPDRQQIVRMNIEKALHFPEEYYRIDDVQPAHHKTFSWVFESAARSGDLNLSSWLKYGRGCFWINGKAGSGKSTLMKFLLRSAATQDYLKHWAGHRSLIIAPHFFWHAGTTMQKSLQGVLQSVLRRLIESNHEYAQVLFPEIFQDAMQFPTDDQGDLTEFPEISLTMRQLKNAVDNFLRTPPWNMATLLFIDGVDEYDGDHLWFGKLLVQLSQSQHIKVLVSSRPEPACHYVFSSCPSLRLQDLTGSDIQGYIEDELLNVDSMKQIELLSPGFATQLMSQLTLKASGVFLWVILVVRQLHNGLMNQDEPETLLRKVDELPERLEALYDHMFSKLSPQYQREGTLLLLITKRAKTAPSKYTALQAFFAGPKSSLKLPPLGSGAKSTTAAQLRENALISVLDGRLRSRCCGLLEVRYKDNGIDIEPEVDFLHKTVIDYMNENELWEKTLTRAGLSVRDIDIMLLESCNLATQHCPRPCLTGPSTRFTQQCFRYAIDWYTGNDECVSKSLLKADHLLLQNCVSAPVGERQSSTYYDFYLALVMARAGKASPKAQRKHEQESYNKLYKDSKEEEILTSMSPSFHIGTHPIDMTFPLFWIALCGLPHFWRAKLEVAERVDKSRLLSLLLSYCAQIHTRVLEQRLSDLAIILPCLDPNACQQQLAIDFPTTPWHQWLLFMSGPAPAKLQRLYGGTCEDQSTNAFQECIPPVWRITNILLKAGAETRQRGQAAMAISTIRSNAQMIMVMHSKDVLFASELAETLELLGEEAADVHPKSWFKF